MAGATLTINKNTLNMLYDIEPNGPIHLDYKGISWNEPISKILKFYINHKSVEMEEIIDIQEVKERYKNEQADYSNPFADPTELKRRKQQCENNIHIELDTYENLKYVTKTYFPPLTELVYEHDTVLQRVAQYSINNNNLAEYKKSINKK